jgi:hypothetical protein
MLTGLEILLARMKTNPEEFLDTGHVPYEGQVFGGKWSDLLDYAWRVAEKDERDALEAARKEFYRDDFNERVMKRLAGEEVKQVEQPSPYIVKQQGQHWTDPRMALQNSALQGGTVTTTIGQAALQANGFGQVQIKAEGQPVGYDGGGFLGLGRLF